VSNPKKSVNYIMTVFETRLTIGVCLPFCLAFVGILGKRLSRGAAGKWMAEDSYFGKELLMAGISASILNMLDYAFRLHGTVTSVTASNQLAGASLYPNGPIFPYDTGILFFNFVVAFIGMLLFMFVLTLHQDYENNPNKSRNMQLFMLGGVANMIGFGVLLAGVAAMP